MKDFFFFFIKDKPPILIPWTHDKKTQIKKTLQVYGANSRRNKKNLRKPIYLPEKQTETC
ncbi:hypothetical protein V6Z11_D07G256400 [Gossypium hirsutum]